MGQFDNLTQSMSLVSKPLQEKCEEGMKASIHAMSSIHADMEVERLHASRHNKAIVATAAVAAALAA